MARLYLVNFHKPSRDRKVVSGLHDVFESDNDAGVNKEVDSQSFLFIPLVKFTLK